METFDVVVVGAGQAGLAISCLLTEALVPHVVLERGRVGESWRSQRWDTFALNTPNWCNRLPGMSLAPDDPDGFVARDDVVTFLERYADSFDAPVRDQTTVTCLRRQPDDTLVVETTDNTFRARNVVVCSGALSEAAVPEVAADVPPGVASLSAATYRTPVDLPDGGVLVVGSGQSGCQVAEDLLAAGRDVWLSVSQVGRVPRRYRGRDIFAWLVDLGFFDMAVEQLEDPAMQYAAQPQVSGTDGGHTVSLQSLAREGATLLGRVEGFDGTVMRLRPSVREAAAAGDDLAARVRDMVDGLVERTGIDAPDAEPDPNEPAMPDLGGSGDLRELDLAVAGITSVVWCTGFTGDFSWVEDDLLDERGLPHHDDGVAPIPGLYYVGFPWLSSRKSGILLGVGDDAQRIAQLVTGTA